ncbi:hypothetical protein [Xanthomonas arboricola]|uniref:hypothetical protein n=1 Tax=Xanthomonas arboricola TaxID=56448 RepID=UPI0011AFDF1E|nr:hypothetical protein [Xanthomonas arboricola]
MKYKYTNKTLAACGLALLAAISAQAQAAQHYISIGTNPGQGYHAHAELKTADGRLIYTWDKGRDGKQNIYWTYNYGNDNARIEMLITVNGKGHTFKYAPANGNICIEFSEGLPYGVACSG